MEGILGHQETLFYNTKTCNFSVYSLRCQKTAYGRNQSGCEKAKKVRFLTSILWVFLTIYTFFYFHKNYHVLKASRGESYNVIADTEAQFSDFKLGKKLFQFMRYEILKFVNQNLGKFEFDR